MRKTIRFCPFKRFLEGKTLPTHSTPISNVATGYNAYSILKSAAYSKRMPVTVKYVNVELYVLWPNCCISVKRFGTVVFLQSLRLQRARSFYIDHSNIMTTSNAKAKNENTTVNSYTANIKFVTAGSPHVPPSRPPT